MTYINYVHLMRSSKLTKDDIPFVIYLAKRDIELNKPDYYSIVRIASQITCK